MDKEQLDRENEENNIEIIDNNDDVEIVEFEEEDIGENLKKLTPEQKARKPDYRVLQLDTDKNGRSRFVEVGAMWIQESSKTGENYYILKIGKLKLFVFKNNNKGD